MITTTTTTTTDLQYSVALQEQSSRKRATERSDECQKHPHE